ncbi:hypothetical protein HG530_006299 [Fusarium avenaceum]|nr:hypothetical protein HG530_006299 [Fusarium avenaceum]
MDEAIEPILLTKLQADAGTLDVALRHGGVELDALVEILGGFGVVAQQSAEGTSHVVGKSLVLAKIAELQSLLECLSSLLVTITSLLLQSLEANLHLSLASMGIQLFRILESFGSGLGTEALEIVANEDRAGQLGGSGLHHLLGLLLSEGLEKSLDSLGGGLALEVVDDARGSEIEEGLGVLLLVLVGGGATVDGLDVVRVHVDSGGGVLNDLIPFAHGAVTGGSVGVEDRVGLAENGLGVKFNGFVV